MIILRIEQFSETSCYFLSLSLKSKHSPRHSAVFSDTFSLNSSLYVIHEVSVILKEGFVIPNYCNFIIDTWRHVTNVTTSTTPQCVAVCVTTPCSSWTFWTYLLPSFSYPKKWSFRYQWKLGDYPCIRPWDAMTIAPQSKTHSELWNIIMKYKPLLIASSI
jgi:hypothetical protein